MVTRFYYEANTVPVVTPPFDVNWTTTANAVRRKLRLDQVAATETISGTLGGGAGNTGLAVQLISEPLAAQTFPGTGFVLNGIVSRGRELDVADNIDKRYRILKVVSNDGTTVRATLATFATPGDATELSTSLSGQTHTTGGQLTEFTCIDGDRLVLEIGYGESAAGTTPNWEMGLGGSGTDHVLATNNDTTGTVPWFELGIDVAFPPTEEVPVATVGPRAGTDKFNEALARSHKVAIAAQLLVGDDILDLTPFVVDGRVDVASTATRRTMNLTLVDTTETIIPVDLSDPLAPVGHEIRLWRGIDFQDGTDPELIPIGTFRFTVVDTPSPQIELQGFDRSWVIQGALLENALIIDKGRNYIDAINSVLFTAYGGDLVTNFPDSDEVTPLMTFDVESDPWKIAQELASNLGLDLFFDPMGVATMVPTPDPATTGVSWVFDDQDPWNIGLAKPHLIWDVTDAVNAVIVIGENSGSTTAFRGTAYDQDSLSPTQYGSHFGKRPITIRDEKVTSQAQATQRARSELVRRMGVPQTITIPTMVHPGFEVGDIALLNSSHLGNTSNYGIFDRFTVPLRAKSGMEIACRQRTVTSS